MHVHFAGTRGSAPVTRSDCSGFGGDTTCLLVTGNEGEQIVIDCGSGLTNVSTRLEAGLDLMILLTHYHLDHLIGLIAFPLLHTPEAQLLFAAPPADGVTPSEALGGIFRNPYWPVDLERCGAEISFADLPSGSGTEPMLFRGIELRWTPLPHPGGCTAYRLDEPATGSSMVLATDAEWEGAPDHMRQEFVRFCREPSPCDLLICDGQYDDTTAGSRRGWGHSSWSEAVSLAGETGCRRLLLTHHDPADDDAVLTERELRLKDVLPTAALARQGLELDLARKDPS